MNIIVTGAASGIGKALCEALLKDGHRVFGVDINEVNLRGLLTFAAPERVQVQQLDVREPDAWAQLIARAVERFGHIDVLCNVAGYLKPGYSWECTAEDVARHADINVKGVIFGVQSVLPHMRARGAGHIVNIASIAGLSPVPGLALYSMTKYAVRSYSLSVALELRDQGIAVTCICPDAVQTPMLDLQRDYPQAALVFSGGRSLTTTDVVRAIIRSFRTRPFEVIIPRYRGWMARLGNVFPSLHLLLGPMLRKIGLAAQKKD